MTNIDGRGFGVRTAGLGVRRDRDPLVGDHGDDGSSVLAVLEDRRLAHGTVPSRGQLRERAELCDLAVERLVDGWLGESGYPRKRASRYVAMP